MTELNASQILAVARLRAVKMLPYFFDGVYALIFVEKVDHGTLSVTARGVCFYDPATVIKWGVENTAGVLLHEVGHVLRKHHLRVEALGIPATEDNARIINICEDAEIDDDLIPAKIPHPKSHPLIDPVNLPHKDDDKKHTRGQLFETYWDNWPVDKKGAKQQSGFFGKGTGCGGCAGNPVPGEPIDGTHEGKGRSDAELERVRHQVAEKIQAHMHTHGQGSVPGGWEVWAGEIIMPATISWRDELSTIVGQACAVVAGDQNYAYDRPNRRQWALGMGDGFPIRPRMVSHIPKVDLAFDTSGSMLDGVALPAAAAEANGVLDAVGAETRMLACDSKVHTIAIVETIEEILAAMSGGGGTSFVPVFEAIEESGESPDILIFFTDGCGEAPAIPPPYPVIFVEVGRYARRPWVENDYDSEITWGHHIIVPPMDENSENRGLQSL